MIDLHRHFGINYQQKILPSIVNEVVKSVIAMYSAQDLINKRDKISQKIRDQLDTRCNEFYMDLQDMSLMEVYFSPDYHRAIERKQVAEQLAERSKFFVEKAKQEKKSTIIKAEAQAIATELIGKEVRTNPAYLKMKKIEIAQ